MAMDEGLGYPKAYAKLCRDRSFGPFGHGPPFTFTPYALNQQEEARARELEEMFPIIDLKAKPTTKPRIFLSLLWKQLNHLGNAGFDPELIRVDMYGNVLYYHADAICSIVVDSIVGLVQLLFWFSNLGYKMRFSEMEMISIAFSVKA